MKISQPEVKQLTDKNPYKLIEKIGRICYKSEDKITEDSYKGFVKRLIDNKHFAMLEHAVIPVGIEINKVDIDTDESIQDFVWSISNIPGLYIQYSETPFSWKFYCVAHISLSHIYNPRWHNSTNEPLFEYLKDYIENKYNFCENADENKLIFGNIDPLYATKILIGEEQYRDIKIEKYSSMYFLTDIGVGRELARHRCAVAQASTRYINFAKDKFGKEIKVVPPSEFETWDSVTKAETFRIVGIVEQFYMFLIDKGIKPEIARWILQIGLETEIVLTMAEHQWKHFVDIRYHDATGKAHPDIKLLAAQVEEILHL